MAWRSAPLRADKVTYAAKSDLDGEKECITFPIRVNRYSDRPRRTLLAWQRLIVMRCFMPVGLMQLYVTIR